VFAWFIGNGDMHRKNLSLLTTADGKHVLSPAYDLLCTRLVLPNDQLALSVDGRKDRLTVGTWMNFASYCGIPERAAQRVLSEILAVTDAAKQLVSRSYLSAELKAEYLSLIDRQSETLRASD
jgi:serine/threonine-protein kinase HipA